MSVRLLCLAVLVSSALVAADAPALTTTLSGLKYVITTHGSGPQPHPGQVVIAHYRGTLDDGTVFDDSRTRDTPFAFTLGKGNVIKGWDEGFALLHVGDHAIFVIPPELAYGERARTKIPANSTLRFEIEFIGLKEHALSDALRDSIEQDGLGATRALFEKLQAAGMSDYHVSESQINAQGYRYLRAHKYPEALALFQINRLLFPRSANVYDSLGEAFWKSGQSEVAINCYRQSLELDPKNENARKMIEELTAGKI